MLIPIPDGYRFAAVDAGFKKPNKLDLGLIVSETDANVAAVFTTNKFLAAPVQVAKGMLGGRKTARSVLINSGQANACTGAEGIANCKRTLELVGRETDIKPIDILPASTGVIGPQLLMDKWKDAAPALAANLGQSGPQEFARAIMTTDAYPKLAWKTVEPGSAGVQVLGIAKGAGMICPNMATMLATVITDAAVEQEMWQEIVTEAVNKTLNSVTVDGDTSTNDTVYALANGASGVRIGPGDKESLVEAVTHVLGELGRLLVEDGEGATKVLNINVSGAKDDAQAELVARTVGHSPLVKTAFYGKDANWGRIVMAIGRSGADFDPDEVHLCINGLCLFEKGRPIAEDFDSLLAASLRRQHVVIDITMGTGKGRYELLASDLSHEYVTINADYRS